MLPHISNSLIDGRKVGLKQKYAPSLTYQKLKKHIDRREREAYAKYGQNKHPKTTCSILKSHQRWAVAFISLSQ